MLCIYVSSQCVNGNISVQSYSDWYISVSSSCDDRIDVNSESYGDVNVFSLICDDCIQISANATNEVFVYASYVCSLKGGIDGYFDISPQHINFSYVGDEIKTIYVDSNLQWQIITKE